MAKEVPQEEAAFRAEHLKGFTDECQKFSDEISALFKGVPVKVEIEEWTSDDLPSFYYIHADFRIPDVLSLLSMTWDPRKKILDRNVIILTTSFQGQGYGTKIEGKIVEMARQLNAERFRVSAIVEPRWKQSMLKRGFIQDPTDEDAVYKDLKKE